MRHFILNKTRLLYGKLPFFIAFFLIAYLLSGCTLLTPKTETLKQVHNTYRQEFIKLLVPSPSTGIKDVSDDASFAGTLAEIRAFKSKYGEDTIEAQHLDVLEAMIYLQSNQFGMASLMKNKVAKASEKLQSRTGEYTRDQLFAQSFVHLLSGWAEIQKAKENGKPDAQTLKTSAEGIKKILGGPDPKKYSEADDGAIYLATTAAIFYTWVFDIEGGDKESLYKAGSDLIGRFLSESEREVAKVETKKINPIGLERNPRLRYIQWYNYLINSD